LKNSSLRDLKKSNKVLFFFLPLIAAKYPAFERGFRVGKADIGVKQVKAAKKQKKY
jgi:hypothetical protein